MKQSTTSPVWPIAFLSLLVMNLGVSGVWIWSTLRADPAAEVAALKPAEVQLAREEPEGIHVDQKPTPAPLTITELPPPLMVAEAAQADAKTLVAPKPPAAVIEVRKMDVRAILNDADALMRDKQYASALARYQQAEKATPSLRPLVGQAAAQLALGRDVEAVNIWRDVLRKAPQRVDYAAQAAGQLAEADTHEAYVMLKDIAEKFPQLALVHSAVSQQAARRGEAHLALIASRRALDLDVGNLVYRKNHAILLDQMGDEGNALAAYDSVIHEAEQGGEKSEDLNGMRQRATYLRGNNAALKPISMTEEKDGPETRNNLSNGKKPTFKAMSMVEASSGNRAHNLGLVSRQP